VNIVETSKGGTHVDGFERTLVKAVNEAARAAKALKDRDENVIKDDITEGLTAVVVVRIPEPEFESQTKDTLGTPQARKIVAEVVAAGLKEYFSDPKRRAESRRVLDKVVQAARTRIAARQHKETIRRKNALESSSLPTKLRDCHSTDLERAELLIIEGDSAGGTVSNARDSDFQAFLPLKGKPLNVQKSSERKMLDNDECAAIITAMGAGSGNSFDISQIRYGKLIIMADADVDGSHIRTLLMTLVFKYMRPLLEAGRLYSAVPPLHRITLKGSGEHHYTYTDEEMAAKVAELERAGKAVKEVQRYKGLGEMDADQLAETTLDPAHRKLRRMTMADAEAASEYFELCMGSDVPNRKAFIIARSAEVDRATLDL
jgi:DNA gyrase subunit B